jgi:hypothetical protein
MNESDNREARTGRVADWGAATIGVPTEDLAGEVQAAHRITATISRSSSAHQSEFG